MAVRVLVADPDEYLLRCYHDYLEQRGFQVMTVTSGLECVERTAGDRLGRARHGSVVAVGRRRRRAGHDERRPDHPIRPRDRAHECRDRSVLYRMAPFRIDDFQTKPLSGKRLAERILGGTATPINGGEP